MRDYYIRSNCSSRSMYDSDDYIGDVLSKVKQSQDSKNIIKKLNFEWVPNCPEGQENRGINVFFKSMNHNITISKSKISSLITDNVCFRTFSQAEWLYQRGWDMLWCSWLTYVKFRENV